MASGLYRTEFTAIMIAYPAVHPMTTKKMQVSINDWFGVIIGPISQGYIDSGNDPLGQRGQCSGQSILSRCKFGKSCFGPYFWLVVKANFVIVWYAHLAAFR